MNYGYGPSCPKWNRAKQKELAKRLRDLVMKYQDISLDIDNPYIEVDGLYEGVRIRKITYLSDQRQNELVAEADTIYDEIMGIKTKPETLEWRKKILAQRNTAEAP